jgi:hypothetical protein
VVLTAGQPSLHAHDRPITTTFGLLGIDENALSFGLAYTFQQCPLLLHWFLGQIGLPGVRRSAIAKARIDLQRHQSGDSGQGITDIEIHLPGEFHVIVEAKLGLAVPTIEQCRKYLPRFKATNEPFQKLVAVVQSPDQSFVTAYGQQDKHLSTRLVGFNWPQLFPECVRLMLGTSVPPRSKEWVRTFYSFLDQEFRMKAFTTEVWILAIDTKPLWPNGMSFWNIHQKYSLYFDRTHPTVRPLYFAFRVNGQVDAIYRVSRIEQLVRTIDLVPELVHLKKPWPKEPYTIWHFGPPVPLANPLRTGSGMYNRRVRCDLDLLLTCKTVQKIEEAMGKRRAQADH